MKNCCLSIFCATPLIGPLILLCVWSPLRQVLLDWNETEWINFPTVLFSWTFNNFFEKEVILIDPATLSQVNVEEAYLCRCFQWRQISFYLFIVVYNNHLIIALVMVHVLKIYTLCFALWQHVLLYLLGVYWNHFVCPSICLSVLFCSCFCFCLDDIFCTSQPFFNQTWYGGVLYEAKCHAEKMMGYLQCQGHSEGLCNQNVTFKYIF